MFEIKASAGKTAGRAKIKIYGEIADGWLSETDSKRFSDELDALGDVDQLDIHINSPGGSVTTGQAIYTNLKNHKAKKVVYIDGMAASMGSVIAMVGDEIIMPENAIMMIHNPWCGCQGDSNEFRKMAETLDILREGLIATYVNKTKLPKGEIIEIIDKETWLSAKDAIKLGFADKVAPSLDAVASIKGKSLNINGLDVDLSNYKNIPDLNGMLGISNNKTKEESMNKNEKVEQAGLASLATGFLSILGEIKDILKGKNQIASIPELWDGQTASRVVNDIKSFLIQEL